MHRIVEIVADPSLPFLTIFLRLVLSVVLGLFIGIEREMHRQPAGMRTHILICVGATLVTIASMLLPLSTSSLGISGDSGRIAAQIVSGIGFLGAGAIIKFGATVRGITTAATIWVTAAIGITIGLGLFYFAIVATIFVLVVLVGFEIFEQRLFATEFFKTLEVVYHQDALDTQEISRILTAKNIRIRTLDLQYLGNGEAIALLHIRISELVQAELLLKEVLALPSVRSVKLNQEYR
ncbi:MAG: MgtC/SapB family protein [Bacteroides sp.]